MDILIHLPESARGNTFLLLFQDMFSGYVMCKPMSSTTAEDVAEAYEEQVFQIFGASSMIRHDQDHESSVHKPTTCHTRIPPTSEWEPGEICTNGYPESSSIRCRDDQPDWDDQAERLMFALNVSLDATRLDTPFYLVHGWDDRSTFSAMLGPKHSSVPERSAYEWRRKLLHEYSYGLACAEDLQKMRSDEQTRKCLELSERVKAGFEKGDSVWLYIPKVQTGLSRKLAHMWHGPFRIDEIRDDFRVRLKVKDTGYRVNPWVHISRLKPRVVFPKRPTVEVDVADDDDFDAALLPEDSWESNSSNDVFEVESIQDVRWVKRTRTARQSREYLVKWKGYDDSEWIPVTQLNCGSLLYEVNKGTRARARFQAMQDGDDHLRV
ncbi:hypothetical protein PHMEG_00019973 [Phytophthora megakarya]|uniref:Chromo domain-containing protein n=1 Tax=Phytophthora megakarya TaxID=4795 RepID=A0A225VQL8_9STRA|nr:hypothetical protein PHMEG_00019973 [Phytophthora megakarya]